ncbi:Putative amidotransferase [Actinoalloteichus hymeniacidonis]|uniref:Amidotransferase n=2 Tax=Actinoalloteichus hymeniacidonis TaxID=340345 RepID=A0AAC9MYZ4_9PSEU|nr:Putative amidotransferase [Actinoalloteichus hymeniacidonis]
MVSIMTTEQRTIAFVIYPGLTPLDIVGPLQVLAGLAAFVPEYRVAVVAANTEKMPSDSGLLLAAEYTFDEVPDPFIVVVPGGMTPTLAAMTDERLLRYLRESASGAHLMTSVCTGALLLGAAGLLEGRRATTHWMFVTVLAALGATPARERWVQDGPVLTAAGVAAGIDMALHLAQQLEGEEVARRIQTMIEYDPEPPLGSIDWSTVDIPGYTPVLEQTMREALGEHPELLEKLVARLPRG